MIFKPDDVVIDDTGFYGTVVLEPKDGGLVTPKHVWVKPAKGHPQAWLNHPIPCAPDRLRKAETAKK